MPLSTTTQRPALPLFALVATLLGLTNSPAHADWPTDRATPGRTAYTADAVPARLAPHAMHRGTAPAPAWPAPARRSFWQRLEHIEPRVTDDQSVRLVAAAGVVAFGSATDCHVTCLDADTLAERWAFPTDAPVRFAPIIDADRGLIFAGSDDGHVYAIDLDTGDLRWRTRVAPDDTATGNATDLIPGNGRLISRWPVRTGLALRDGTLYAAAGLFPSQGVYAAALATNTGDVLWREDLGERSPQGYLLTTDDLLILPAGRSTPFALRRDTGDHAIDFGGTGGSFAVVVDDQLHAGRGNSAAGDLTVSSTTTGERFVQTAGKHLVVTPRLTVVLTDAGLLAIDRIARRAAQQRAAALRERLADDPGDADFQAALADAEQAVLAATLWERPIANARCMIGAGDALFLGTDAGIQRLDLRTGEPVASLPAPAPVAALAFADGQLLASTDQGTVLSYTAAANPTGTFTAAHSDAPDAPTVTPDADDRNAIAATLGVLAGYAAVLTDEANFDTALLEARALAALGLHTVLIPATDAHADAARAALRPTDDAGRVTVLPRGRGQLVEGFANVVCVLGETSPARLAAARRWVTPERGLLRTRSTATEEWTDTRRGPVPGGGAWTHQFADAGAAAATDDIHAGPRPLLQWFGGPGPNRMIDRHLRGPVPLAVGGRLFIHAENRLVAVDAYNGTELWDLTLPDAQRYAMHFDAGYTVAAADRLHTAVDGELWTINAATGDVTQRFAVPHAAAPFRVPGETDGNTATLHWGAALACAGSDDLVATLIRPTAPYTQPGRPLADSSYNPEQPSVTARALLRVNPNTGDLRWSRNAGRILHTSLVLADDKLFFVEARHATPDDDGKIPLPTLLANDAWLVALNANSGDLLWEEKVDPTRFRDILYLTASDRHLLVIGSANTDNRDAGYHLRVLEPDTGDERWRADHVNGEPGQLGHGEQVHHPVLLGDTLVAEPYLYHLQTGERLLPDGTPGDWAIRRPGHSCGTISGANGCLYFRAANPTLLTLDDRATDANRFQRLAPTRAGCWINILPAQGLVLIPEGSASCVCNYPLQTSMAFRPREDWPTQ